MSELRDLLPPSLLVDPERVRVIAEGHFNGLINTAVTPGRTQTPQAAKNILETMELVRQAIKDYELRTHVTEEAKIDVTYAKPDVDRDIESISVEIVRREPGMFGQGAPFGSATKNLRPILRENVRDPEHPGYRRAVLGYFYDNMLRFTCWARTNKAANERVLWLENVMEEYSWFFVYSGANRVLYQGQRDDVVNEVGNNKYYGRPVDYFVRTEKLRQVSEKTLEEICIRFGLGDAPK